MIRGDSGEYNLLEKWSKNFDCQGHYSCEIGVREGQGSKIILDNVINNYFHIGVDPYGDRKYQHFDNDIHYYWEGTKDGRPPTYPDSMRDNMLKDFEDYRVRGKFHFVNKTDIDFMNTPDYNNQELKKFKLCEDRESLGVSGFKDSIGYCKKIREVSGEDREEEFKHYIDFYKMRHGKLNESGSTPF